MELPIPPVSGEGFAIRGRERRRRGGDAPFELEGAAQHAEEAREEEAPAREHGDFAAPGEDEAGRRLDVSA